MSNNISTIAIGAYIDTTGVDRGISRIESKIRASGRRIGGTADGMTVGGGGGGGGGGVLGGILAGAGGIGGALYGGNRILSALQERAAGAKSFAQKAFSPEAIPMLREVLSMSGRGGITNKQISRMLVEGAVGRINAGVANIGSGMGAFGGGAAGGGVSGWIGNRIAGRFGLGGIGSALGLSGAALAGGAAVGALGYGALKFPGAMKAGNIGAVSQYFGGTMYSQGASAMAKRWQSSWMDRGGAIFGENMTARFMNAINGGAGRPNWMGTTLDWIGTSMGVMFSAEVWGGLLGSLGNVVTGDFTGGRSYAAYKEYLQKEKQGFDIRNWGSDAEVRRWNLEQKKMRRIAERNAV